MDQAKHRIKKRGESPSCPFCQEKVARPSSLDSPLVENLSLDCLGGSCSCGSLFLFDATGRQGGQLLMDGLALLCGGDLDQALSLEANTDYQIISIGYSPRMHTIVPQQIGRTFGQPKLWFFKLLRP